MKKRSSGILSRNTQPKNALVSSRSVKVITDAASLPEARRQQKAALCVVSGEREHIALWLQVILQALIDAQCGSSKPEYKRARAEAIAWFSLQNEDFREVCALAALDPYKTVAGARAAIRESRKERKRPGGRTVPLHAKKDKVCQEFASPEASALIM